MSRKFLLFFFFAFLIIFVLTPPTYSIPINIWPLPANLSWPSPKATPISPTFKILTSTTPLHPHLSSAIARTTSLLFSENYSPILPSPLNFSLSSPLHSLLLTITSPSSPLCPSSDESYTLQISSSSSSSFLNSSTIWGAMRGLQTFSQLTWSNDPVLIADDIFISDSPLYAHRGLMLDTARNFFPVKDILRTIEAMAMNKMNVFHWHVTDSQSFPVVLPSVPELAGKGAYKGMVYTASDVMEIVEFGLGLGVRVVPEFDMPG